MKLIATCGLGQCPRILQDANGAYVVIGKTISLEEQIGLNLETDERAVRIPQDVMVEAARLIMLQLAQG